MTTYSPSPATARTDRVTNETRGTATARHLLDHRAQRDEDLFRDHGGASHETSRDAPEALTHTIDRPRPGTLTRSAPPASHHRRKPLAEPTGPEKVPVAAAGPSARLRALPQPVAEQLATPDGVDSHLAELEAARQAQLDALPVAARNVAVVAHRDTVVWILEQIRVARQRLREDLYGFCARCGTSIGPERLTVQPWQTTCSPCAPADRPVVRLPPATGR